MQNSSLKNVNLKLSPEFIHFFYFVPASVYTVFFQDADVSFSCTDRRYYLHENSGLMEPVLTQLGILSVMVVWYVPKYNICVPYRWNLSSQFYITYSLKDID